MSMKFNKYTFVKEGPLMKKWIIISVTIITLALIAVLVFVRRDKN